MEFIATAKIGLESTVAFQLHKLGILDTETFDARVKFFGGYAEMAKALLWLRTAERLLMTVGVFHADTFDQLFEQTKALPWDRYLSPKTKIHVNGKSAKSTLFSVSDCQSIVKKAIVESLKASYRVSTVPETEEEVIVARLSSRRTCRSCGYTAGPDTETCPRCGGEMYQRDDDKPETIQRRLDVYEQQTSPLIEYYKGHGLLLKVDGDRPVDEVYADVKEALGL